MTPQDTTDEPLTTEHRAELRAVLLAKRGLFALTKAPRSTEPRGDLPDPMDAAAVALEDEERIIFSHRDQAVVAEIDHALARLDDGTYGACERSGEPIGYARLRAVPWARLTVREAEEQERRLRR
jgi:DnaK suppressor protein